MADRKQDQPTTRRISGDEAAQREGWVNDITQQLETDFQERDKVYRALDAILWGEHKVNIPLAYAATAVPVRSPLPLHIVSTIAAALSVNPQQIHFEPVGRGQKGQDNAERREHFFEASWARQEHEARRQLLRLFLWNLVARGEGVLKTLDRRQTAWGDYPAYQRRLKARLDDPSSPDYTPDPDQRDGTYNAATEEYKQARAYPIVSSDVDPLAFRYFRAATGGFSVAAEITEVPYLDTLTRFGAGLDGNGTVVRQEAFGLPRTQWAKVMGGTTTITCKEVWIAGEVTYALSGPGQVKSQSGKDQPATWVKSQKHRYGDTTGTLRGPYFHALGTTTAERTPERQGIGVLFPFLSLFPLLDAYLTMQSNAAFLTAYPSFKRTQPPGANLAATLGAVAGPQVAPYGMEGTERDALNSLLTKIEPGYVYPWDVAPIEQPRSGVDLDKAMATTRGLIELALPSVVQGVVSGDTSGYALNQAAHLARLSWDPSVSNAEFALSERCSFESWMIQHVIGETVYAFASNPGVGAPRRSLPGSTARGMGVSLGWLGVGPEELNGAHRYSVKLDPETPSNKVLEIRAHVEMVQAGFETRAMAIEQLGGDPGEVERGLLVENLKRSPEIQNRLKQQVLELLGLGEQQQLGPFGGGPGAGPGGGGPGGPPGSGAAGGPGGPGLPPPGGPAPGGAPPGLPDVHAPGQNMPLTPTPPGAVTGMGPGMGAGGGLPATPAGSPVIPNPPGMGGMGQ